MLLHLLRREHTEAQCKHFQSAVTRISNLQHKPLVLLPYLFAKQLCPSGLTCPHCHAHLLYILLRTKCTPTKAGVVTEIHSSASSCVVIWKVPRFRQLSQPTYSFDFRTPQNRVLHMRIDPRVRPRMHAHACALCAPTPCGHHLEFPARVWGCWRVRNTKPLPATMRASARGRRSRLAVSRSGERRADCMYVLRLPGQ